MKRLAVVLFAWWFLGIGPNGSGSWNSYLLVVGPFNDKEECENIANWVRQYDRIVKSSPCWQSEKAERHLGPMRPMPPLPG